MSGLPKEYRGLMRDAVRREKSASSSTQQRPLKRRKRTRKEDAVKEENKDYEPSMMVSITSDDNQSSGSRSTGPSRRTETIDLTSDVDDSEDSKEETPGTPKPMVINFDVNQETPEPTVKSMNAKEVTEGDSDDDDFDDDEFEDVDLENVKPKASHMITEDVVIAPVEKEEDDSKTRKKRNIISKEERHWRRTFHRNYLASMMVHGFIRNNWCNDIPIHEKLKKLITASIYDELHPPRSVELPQMRTRRFLDGLRHLMAKWMRFYKVTSNKGIYKHDWYDWRELHRSPTSLERFKRCMERGRGTRDIGAQGFVALLRAADVPSRLVFSLQPPDFTNRQIKGRDEEAKPEKSNDGPQSAKDKLLALRKGKTASPKKVMATQAEIEMVYPVFWAEAWDNASKTWITIDPIMMQTIENVKYKSKLEPPLSHPYNSLTYVIGYDKKGGVRDITKRYAEKYYSKTRKKRITKEESDDIWYSGFLDALNSRPRNRADQYEDEYFTKRAEQEGMPDNIQDFKGHPFYVLESQLKSNEIVHPKDPCGMLRVKGRNEAIQVYKRSNVQYLRSPRAWYQRGRLLKAGAQPMKTRQKTHMQMSRNVAFDDDDEDKEERLYAEFQTELYVPPPATDGLITKNAFGNIDIFVDSMIPEGAVLIDTPYAEDAAKALGIDYAPAVIGFKFDRRQASPKIGGVVVGVDFKEAMEVVQEQLKHEAAEKERMALEIRAMKGWSLLLTKLRIKQRLDKCHGKLDEDQDADSEEELKKLEAEYEEYAQNDDEDDELSFGEESETESPVMIGTNGGFLAEDGVWDPEDDDEENRGELSNHNTGAGFVFNDDSGHVDNGAGFVIHDRFDEQGNTGGGFLMDDHEAFENPENGHDQEEDRSVGSDHKDNGTLQTGAGFVIDEEAHGENDELEDYEAFLDNIGDDYDAYSDEEEPVNENYDDVGPLSEDPPKKVTQSLQSEEEDSDELPGQEATAITKLANRVTVVNTAPPPDFIPPPSHEIIATEHSDLPDPKAVCPVESPPPEDAPVKSLDHDEELEKQFNEQLEREREVNLEEATEEPIDDDEFEYDSE